MDSILTSIKKLLGIDEFDENFDTDIVIHINMALATLNQLGAGPLAGFFIEDNTKGWSDFTDVTPVLLHFIKTYIYLKVKLVFDPPQSSAAVESIGKQIAEAEWRIQVGADPPYVPVSTTTDDDENWADGW